MRVHRRVLALLALVLLGLLVAGPVGAQDPVDPCADIEGENPCPDLQVAFGQAPTPGADDVTFDIQVSNVGTETSPPTTLTLDAPGWETATVEVSALRPDITTTIPVTMAIPDEVRGVTSPFTATVDPNGEIDEISEENNVVSVDVAVPAPEPTPTETEENGGDGEATTSAECGDPAEGLIACPDLTVEIGDTRVIGRDGRLEVEVRITNVGAAASPATVARAESISFEPTESSVDALAPEESTTTTIDLGIPEGTQGTELPLRVTVNPEAAFSEDDFDNNLARTIVTIPGGAEAAPSSNWIPWAIAGAAVLIVAAAAALAARRWRRPKRAVPARAPGRAIEETVLAASPPLKGIVDLDASPPRTVSSGFAPVDTPEVPVDPDMPLQCSSEYYFWLEVGPPVSGAIDDLRMDLPRRLGRAARITVVLFPLDDGLSVPLGSDLGELNFERDGTVRVGRQPAAIGKRAPLADRRMFFLVNTADVPRTSRLRCNFYCRGELVQSRLIYVGMSPSPTTDPRSLRSTVDFTIAPSLDPSHLGEIQQHELSIMTNRSPDGTHNFFFFGKDEFHSQATLDGHELQNLIEKARGALRRATWGDDDPWTESKRYLYGQVDPERFKSDLIRLAIRGYRLYDAVINRLAGDYEASMRLAQLMRRPGIVQVASKVSPRFVVPMALFYDYPLDSTAYFEDYLLCPEFLQALESDRSLEDSPCFRGDCPYRIDDMHVCPSGFWGFRHAMGMPVSVAHSLDSPPIIKYEEGPRGLMAVSTDPGFVLRADHERTLRGLHPALSWEYADTRDQTLKLLRSAKPELVYFYCHGGIVDDVPYIQVGSPGERGITRDVFRRLDIRWRHSRPLVFINGCHTTSLEPEKAIEFVSALVENAQAAGVIGTEITVFEPLAGMFAHEFLRRFVDGQTCGRALRGARLGLLKAGNPLGLVYIPFVNADVHLARKKRREIRLEEEAEAISSE